MKVLVSLSLLSALLMSDMAFGYNEARGIRKKINSQGKTIRTMVA